MTGFSQKDNVDFLGRMFNSAKLQPDLSGNPFVWLEKLSEKRFGNGGEKAAQIITL